jgi:hypothetical protein
MKTPHLRAINRQRAREAFAIESVPGPTFHCNQNGDNVGRIQGGQGGIASTVSLPRVRFLEDRANG